MCNCITTAIVITKDAVIMENQKINLYQFYCYYPLIKVAVMAIVLIDI